MAKKCPTCGERAVEFQPLTNYKFTESGLSDLVIRSGVEKGVCGSCGAGSIKFRGLGPLHRKIALSIATRPGRLRGEEVRFMRKHLGLSARDFSSRVGVDPATVSRWENDKTPMGSIAQRMLRLLVHLHDPEKAPNYAFLDRADEPAGSPKLVISRDKSGWQTLPA